MQEKIADAWMELEQFKLLVLRTAWLIDRNPKDYKVQGCKTCLPSSRASCHSTAAPALTPKDCQAVRKDIAAVKVMTPRVIESVAGKAMRMHGGLGVSWDLPLVGYVMSGHVMGIADGPSEVHKITVAKQVKVNAGEWAGGVAREWVGG